MVSFPNHTLPINPGEETSALVFTIWDRLADFDATQTEDALLFLLQELKKLVGADDAVWIGAVRLAHGKAAERDHQRGWRGNVVVHLEWTDLKRQLVASAMKAQEIDGGIPSFIELARQAGNFRVRVLRELHDMAAFTQTEHYRACFVPFDITDRMWCVFPVNEDCEVAFILDRFGDRPGFSPRDQQLLAATLRGLRWFHRQAMLFHGVMLGGERLSPRERSLCACLLGNRTEKQIAVSLKLTFSTTRTYIKALYKKFGVKGRAGLMALWLGTPP